MELTIDELAQRAGITTRNVRAYQERGLLPPPRKVGRVGIYDDDHLARLTVIATLLERGYSLASIGELLETWEAGKDLGRLLGFERALTRPWIDDAPATVSAGDLTARFGDDPGALQRALDLGLIERDGERFRVRSIEALDAGAELVAAGIPLDAVLEEAVALQADADRVAARFFQLFHRHVWQPFVRAGMPSEQLPRITELMERLRPVASHSLLFALAMAMQRQVDAAIASAGRETVSSQ
jgi:DNA-binding transcriptional MerR regulator